MATQAEINGIKAMAKSMTLKDLKWQIDNAAKLRIPKELNDLFKAELAEREKKL